jgi:hypothetical protein
MPGMSDHLEIAWNDHVVAFEAIAVTIAKLVGEGMPAKDAFVTAWEGLGVPEEYRDKYWRVAVPIIAEYGFSIEQAPDLSGLDLSEIDLEEGDLRGFNFAGTNLSGAFLAKTQLDGANLLGADLSDADLTGASLTGATMPDGTVHA